MATDLDLDRHRQLGDPEVLCGTDFRQGRGKRLAPLASHPGPWRNWCKRCIARLEESGIDDAPDDVVDRVIRATGRAGTGSGKKRLHIPLEELEE